MSDKNKTSATLKQSLNSSDRKDTMDVRMDELLTLFEKLIRVSQEAFNIEEAAEYLRTTPRTIRYYAKRARELPYAKVGRQMVFLKKDLDSFLERRRYVQSSWQT